MRPISSSTVTGDGLLLLTTPISLQASGRCSWRGETLSRLLPDELARQSAAPLDEVPDRLRRALSDAIDVESPRLVTLSGGVGRSDFVDHSYLAVAMGVTLAEGADLVVRRRRLWLRSLDGLEPIDVLYRRVGDRQVDPLDVDAEGVVGVPGVLQAVHARTVGLANAHGAGIIESPALAPFLENALSFVEPTRLALVSDPHGPPPSALFPVASTIGSMPRGATLRFFVVRGDAGSTVIPAGLARVASTGTTEALVLKDVWVSSPTAAPMPSRRLPQVDFARSVPTRAAAGLYWMNRAAERAETLGRLAGAIHRTVDSDPLWWSEAGSVAAMSRVVAAVSHTVGADQPNSMESPINALGHAFHAQIGSMLAEAAAVRDYLSLSNGRVLAHLADARDAAAGTAGVSDREVIDGALIDLAAVAGLWRESTIRSPAWLLGDFGRRLERATVTFDLVGTVVDGLSSSGDESGEQHQLAVLLAALESLVTYRRRHRSEIDPGRVLALVVDDRTNPRSVASALETMNRRAAELEWTEAMEFSADLMQAARARDWHEARALAHRLGLAVTERWFSAPSTSAPLRSSGQG